MKIETQFSTLFISTETDKILKELLTPFKDAKLFILVDENTRKYCLPVILESIGICENNIIEIKSGEQNKSIRSVEKVWEFLNKNGAERSSLLINLGGGIIGDLGGFAASTFKRGMDFINIPTTLLSQVDASIGGKTGINFMGYKNEIGVFNHPKYVIIDSTFNRTLDKRNILSGWAEMLKHTLIFSEADWDNLTRHNINQTGFKTLNQHIARSANIKNHFVEKDPNEKNIRKALNLGHTFGHAFESLFMNTENEIQHGEAVAQGILCELYLSNKICGFPHQKLKKVTDYILKTYNQIKINDSDFEKIIDLMGHDKKNESSLINFTLLEDFGIIKINQTCPVNEIVETLNWYKKL